ncbi:nuclease [Flavobacterium akiainvivens]|uniref:Nuclease n=1 Tax=Flavobacterium akiainvivens TaxID=1202724 RepID=A0A0M9VGP2_9FLAO|nr:DUF3368 domain-containing protein [Flavobacterium akiainvivens]KOS04692.1 nuclease [Flavobacterium akiainvivens]SFQ64957.1 hypothetical protein SAMN05444144_11219 [Flavobacterium akiainvivens]
MKNGIVIADSGSIFSLAVINRLDILETLFDQIKIPNAVWEEITLDKTTEFYPAIDAFFKDKVTAITGFNELTFIMDYGESESVILYKELRANFLLVDDKKARTIAESLNINCIGTLGILSTAKTKQLIPDLRPVFIELLANKRYYSIDLLNKLLKIHQELPI